MKKSLFCLPALLIAAAGSLQAATIGLWTFETGSPSALPLAWTSTSGLTNATLGGILSDVGTGSASGVHASASTIYEAPAGNGSPRSLLATRWTQADYWQFTVSPDLVNNTYSSINVSYDQNGSASSPKTWYFAYSTDGTTFTSVGGDYPLTASISWAAGTAGQATQKSFDLSGVPALNTASTMYFRIVDDSDAQTGNFTGGAISTGGTDRIDNFTVTATVTPVPEPTTAALLGIGLLAFWHGSRRSR